MMAGIRIHSPPRIVLPPWLFTSPGSEVADGALNGELTVVLLRGPEDVGNTEGDLVDTDATFPLHWACGFGVGLCTPSLPGSDPDIIEEGGESGGSVVKMVEWRVRVTVVVPVIFPQSRDVEASGHGLGLSIMVRSYTLILRSYLRGKTCCKVGIDEQSGRPQDDFCHFCHFSARRNQQSRKEGCELIEESTADKRQLLSSVLSKNSGRPGFGSYPKQVFRAACLAIFS